MVNVRRRAVAGGNHDRVAPGIESGVPLMVSGAVPLSEGQAGGEQTGALKVLARGHWDVVTGNAPWPGLP